MFSFRLFVIVWYLLFVFVCSGQGKIVVLYGVWRADDLCLELVKPANMFRNQTFKNCLLKTEVEDLCLDSVKPEQTYWEIKP